MLQIRSFRTIKNVPELSRLLAGLFEQAGSTTLTLPAAGSLPDTWVTGLPSWHIGAYSVVR